MTKAKRNILYAVSRGYKVTKEGRVFRGNEERAISYDKWGYGRFTLNINNTRPSIPVHRLQAYQKFGNKIFEPDIQVRHLDNNPSNNNWDNIEIGTQSNNYMDLPVAKRLARAKHAASYRTKYNAVAINIDREKGMTYNELMKKYNISSKGTISYIVNKCKSK